MSLEVHRPTWELSLVAETRAAPLPILDRMSGLPLGMPPELWPSCDECQKPLAFIGQFACDPQRLQGRSSTEVVYAFLCANPETSGQCHLWQLEPWQQRIGRAVVAEPVGLTFTEPPAGLPTVPRLGLVATAWTTSQDQVVEEDDEAWAQLDHAAKTAAARRGFLERSTRIGGVPVWLQDPFFQNDPERPDRYAHRAEWSAYVPVPTKLFESEWLEEAVARAGAQGVRHLDYREQVAGWELSVRAFATPGYVLIDDTMVRRDADGISTVHTSLDGGRLYLLADTFSGGFELYYIGR